MRRRGAASLLVVLVFSAEGLTAQKLPDGPGSEIVRTRCAGCHDTDLIASQRLPLAGWTREVDKMVRWGAVVSETDRATLQPYLATAFGLAPSVTQAAVAPGAATFARACLACHEADLVQSQRLTRAGWLREVEKMVRWGATVTDAEKDQLIDYLSRRP